MTDTSTWNTLQQESADLRQEISDLNMEKYALRKRIQEISDSNGYKLSQLISGALWPPGLKTLKLPLTLVRFMKNRKQDAAQHIFPLEVGRDPEEPVKALFPPFTPLKKTRPFSNRVAAIVSQDLARDLAFEAPMVELGPDSWRLQLDSFGPCLLLVESLLDNDETGWHFPFHTPEQAETLDAVLEYARKQGIPSAFWHTLAPSQCDRFTDAAKRFDHVFAADRESAHCLSQALGRDVHFLPPGVQPALFNPIDRNRHSPVPLDLMYDGLSDMLEYPDLFQAVKALEEHPANIFESRWKIRLNRANLNIPMARERIYGHLDPAHFITALKWHKLCLFYEKSLSSPANQARRVMESMASGTLAVFIGHSPDGVKDLERLVRVDAGQDPTAAIKELLADPEELARLGHMAMREVLGAHTCSHRLAEIFQAAGIAHDWTEHPLMSMVTPTKRPENMANIVANFTSQTYPNKELHIVINTDDYPRERAEQHINGHPDIHLHVLHQESNVGTCLNLGIRSSKGEYWSKVDDDDLYGPHYIADLVLTWKFHDCDVIGKPPYFFYMESQDGIYARDIGVRSENRLLRYDVVCGATITGTRQGFTEHAFSTDKRNCVDTDFIKDSYVFNENVYCTDRFNFIAIRNKQPEKHTWKIDDNVILNRSTKFCDKLKKKDIFI